MNQNKIKKSGVIFSLFFCLLFFDVSNANAQTSSNVPWAWYVARSTGIVGFILLYLSIFLGLSIRTPFLNKIIKPIYSLNIHRWISVQALIFAAIHGFSLLFDNYFHFTLVDILIPFAMSQELESSGMDKGLLALGIISFYLMIILVVTSYTRKYIGQSLWRSIHFLNISLYFITIIHAIYLGTDLKSSGLAREIFIYANFFLSIIFASNLIWRISTSFSRRNPLSKGE